MRVPPPALHYLLHVVYSDRNLYFLLAGISSQHYPVHRQVLHPRHSDSSTSVTSKTNLIKVVLVIKDKNAAFDQ